MRDPGIEVGAAFGWRVSSLQLALLSFASIILVSSLVPIYTLGRRDTVEVNFFLTKLTVHNTDNSNQRSGTQCIHHPFYSDSLLTL